VVRTFWRFSTVTVSPKIGHDDIKVLSEPRRDLVPSDVRLRPAVEEQHRTAFAAVNKVDGGGARLKDGALEAREQRRCSWLLGLDLRDRCGSLISVCSGSCG
jgi:hypothetical protein